MSRLTSVMKLPKRFTFVFVASIVFCTVGSVYAMDFGAPCSWGSHWPKNWPKELEPLRKQAWHWVDGSLRPANAPPATHLSSRYDIPFADREAFESAWPHILKLKSKGVPVTLLRGSHLSVRTGREAAGVRIPVNIPVTPVDPKAVRIVIGDSKAVGAAVPPSNVTGIELVVDGDIVDLNRIRLPADTPIIDKRFTDRNANPPIIDKPFTDRNTLQAGMVRIKVLDADGKPVTGSHLTNIWLEGDPGGKWGGTATLKNGEFVFKAVPPGRYLISAHPNPHNSGDPKPSKWIVLEPKKAIEVELRYP